MGRGTECWAYVETPEDFTNLQFFKTLYEKNIQRTAAKPLPKLLHFIWLGPKEFPASSVKNIASWIEKHPGWTIKFWTDFDRPLPHPKMQKVVVQESDLPHLLTSYFLSDNFGEKSLLLRYEILFKEGGVYVDHDLLCHKSLNPLQLDFFCGLENLGASILSSSIFPGAHLIASQQGHPIFEEAINWINQNWQSLEEAFPGNTPSAIHNRVKHRSFSALHEGIKRRIDQGGRVDLVFPAQFFSQSKKTDETFATHAHAATWFKEERASDTKLVEECEAVHHALVAGERLLFIAIAVTAGTACFLLFRKRRLLLFILLLSTNEVKAEDFDLLMGKETKHWSYLVREEDNAFLKSCRAIFDAQKEKMISQKEGLKIPKVVHFIWLGPKPFPPESVENVRTWIAHHPDWTVKFWTDRQRPVPCHGMQKILVQDFPFTKLKRCYEQSENYGEKSDILRYEILYREGGVYADHDANSIRSFLSLHAAYDFYCCLEAPHEPFVGQSITCGNGVIGSKPQHPAVKEVIDLIDSRWETLGKRYRGRDTYSRTEVVMQRTYIALTDVLKSGVMNREGNADIVLPAAYFFAKSGLPSIYSKHFYATAWADNGEKKSDLQKTSEKKLDKIQQKSKNITRIALVLLFFNALIVGSLCLKREKF
ncbi:MAG: glycosyltransferase family 32 protein [Chlamydiales bacterium]